MKYLVLLLLFTSGSLLITQEFAYSVEVSLYGSSSFERIPASVIPNEPTEFEIKFQYTAGPYALNNLSPVFDVSPASASSKVSVDVEPIEGILQGQVVRIPVTITVDPSIEHEKIFLSVYFTGEHFLSSSEALYKSAWTDTAIIGIEASKPELIIETHQDQIENIDGVLYYVSESFMPKQSSTEIVSFHDVIFTMPYTKSIPRYIYSNVTFSDGTQETLEVIHDEHDFTDHVDPQAGFRQNSNGGYVFLVRAELVDLSPLRQFKSGISIHEIDCKEGHVVAIKNSNGHPACVKPETKVKLMERGWAEPLGDVVLGRTAPPYPESNKIVDVIIPFDSTESAYSKNFEPQEIRLFLGINNTVRWINESGATITVISHDGKWKTDAIMSDLSAIVTFDEVGVYKYSGVPYPTKSGLAIVRDAPTEITLSILPEKEHYQNGETIQIKGTIDGKSVGHPVNISIIDWEGTIVNLESMELDQYGSFSFNYEISEFCKSGNYHVEVDDHLSSSISTISFAVQYIQTKSINPECDDGKLLNCGVCLHSAP